MTILDICLVGESSPEDASLSGKSVLIVADDLIGRPRIEIGEGAKLVEDGPDLGHEVRVFLVGRRASGGCIENFDLGNVVPDGEVELRPP